MLGGASDSVLTLLLLSFALLALALLDAIVQEQTSTSNLTQTIPNPDPQASPTIQPKVHLFVATLKGRSLKLAKKLKKVLQQEKNIDAHISSFKDCDVEELPQIKCAVFILATYEHGTPPPDCLVADQQLLEAAKDFRFGASSLAGLRYAIFGCGNSEYAQVHFNAFARRVDRSLKTMGAKRIVRRCDGDDIDNRLEEQFDRWTALVTPAVKAACESKAIVPLRRAPSTPGDVNDASGSDDEEKDKNASKHGDVDVEDLGKFMKTVTAEESGANGGPKEMVSPALRSALTKQGYKVIGSHSGVKLCRWTKAMLRGRGGCYKHTFYGIVSYQCMEATPSLACANKCVFCWRHHDNPVGTSFRWKVDEPKLLLEEMESSHKQMVKQMRGVPGVIPERFAEATSSIRHCALSLVGEPVIYPRINEFLDLLHSHRISSFMVTNAQFPDQMEILRKCTQLYVSVDAPTKEQLKAVDRPLFPDFWERFLTCIDLLRKRRQRTTFRLTLVNDWNDSELEAYAALVRRGEPDFVEVKGVTYCGNSKASPLTIKHCPYHAEVVDYCRRLVDSIGNDYAIASEHAHSNCVLIARRAFLRQGIWHTWIDYDRFHDLYASGQPFSSEDYMAPTPEWAVYTPGAVDGGFDPNETHVKVKGRHRPAEGGC